MSKINPATRLYEDMVKILQDFTVKYSSKADYYETYDVRSEAEDFLRAYEKKDTFFSYDDYTIEEYNAVGVTDNADVFSYINDRNSVPTAIQELVLEKRRKSIIDNYEELNEYYRMLNGLPPLDTESSDFVYVPEEYCMKYSIPRDMPIHLIEDEMGKYYISILESNGVIKNLIKENPDKEYLKHLGTKRIDTITARRAKNFEILYMNTNNVMESIQREFIRSYSKARDYFMSVCYIYEYRNVIQYYDNIIGICIFLMTIQQVSARMISNAQDREFYDDYSIQLLYETYGVPFNKKIDELTQKQIVQNVNILVQNKACDKVLLDIASILGFESIKIYEYFLLKERQFDQDGRPIIKYTEKFNEKTGEYETVYDYVNMYDLHFQRVPINEKNLVKALQNKSDRVEYLDLVMYDPFWWEDDETYHNVWETEYNMIETKYLGVTIPYKLTEMLFQSIIQFHMIFDKSEELNDLFVNLPKITESQVQLFDTIILLCALMAKKSHIKGNIIDTPSKILGALEILDRDINKNVPKSTEILKFDFDAFSLNEIEHVKDFMIEKLIENITDDEFEELKEFSSDIRFVNELDGSFYTSDGRYFESNGKRVENVYKNWNTGNYYKQFGPNWFLYNENHELIDSSTFITYNDIINMVNNGEISHANENDIIKSTLLDRYNNNLYVINRIYYPTDKSMRESLITMAIGKILNLLDVKTYDKTIVEELKKRVITIESAEDFINSTVNEITLCENIPRRYFRYFKYFIDETLRKNDFYKYFDVEYVYNKTNGSWNTEIEPDPLVPPTIQYIDNESFNPDEMFAIKFKAKSKFNATKEILESYLVDISYRVVNGHDIDLDANGVNNPKSYKKIREIIKDYKVLEEFYSYISILSSESLGVTPEEKVVALNKIYENAKNLYDFISYHSTRATTNEEFYAFKKMYETIFFAQETKEKFKVKMNDGSDYYPATFLEYLENKNMELYEFVKNIDEDSIYLYIDHIIFHLEEFLDNIDALYVLNDGISPLQELLIQLIDFFKSYTTELVKFSSYMIMDWRMENLIKLCDSCDYVGKSIITNDAINLPYSDFINKYSIRFILDEKLKLLEMPYMKGKIPLFENCLTDDEKNVFFNRRIQTFDVSRPFRLNNELYEDGFFLLRYNSEKIYKEDNGIYYRQNKDNSDWYQYSKDGEITGLSFNSNEIEKMYLQNKVKIDYGILKNNGDINWKKFDTPYNSEIIYKESTGNYYRQNKGDNLWYLFSNTNEKISTSGISTSDILDLKNRREVILDYKPEVIYKDVRNNYYKENKSDNLWYFYTSYGQKKDILYKDTIKKSLTFKELKTIKNLIVVPLYTGVSNVNESDIIAEYFKDGIPYPEKNILLSYNEKTYEVILSESEKEDTDNNPIYTEDFYYDENGLSYSYKTHRRLTQNVQEIDDLFMTNRLSGKAKERITNFMTFVHTGSLTYDEKEIDITSPSLWKIVSETSKERPHFSSKVIQTNESNKLFDTLTVIHGPEKVYQYSDGTFFRFEARAWIKYNSKKERISNREYKYSDLQDEIENGELVEAEIYF